MILIMFDDGEIECCVCLIWLMEVFSMFFRMMSDMFWVEVDRNIFGVVWSVEVVDVLEFFDVMLYVVLGLFLLVWKCLLQDEICVYCLQIDDGECIIGCWVLVVWVVNVIMSGVFSLILDQVYMVLFDGWIVFDFVEGL